MTIIPVDEIPMFIEIDKCFSRRALPGRSSALPDYEVLARYVSRTVRRLEIS
jgi:hypothetical protein